MSVCRFCGQENRTGTLYCAYCSQELPQVNLTVPVNPFETQPARLNLPTNAHASGLTLQVATDNGLKSISLPAGHPIVLGRSDPESPNQPDLDLSAFGALEEGVSRRHAVIDFLEDTARVTDLGSSNGTYINGKQLSANRPHIVNHGDEIRLGKLVLIIYV